MSINKWGDMFCRFCEENSKKETMGGRIFCPNGHYIVHRVDSNIEFEVSQPISNGTNIYAKRIYRRGHKVGTLCDKNGVSL